MTGSERGVLAILLDLGDTIMAEVSEEKDAQGVTQRAELVPGAAEALRALKAHGYRLGLVADTRVGTYQNVLRQHGLYELFDSFAISDEVGCEKPEARMFEKALTDLGVGKSQRSRVLMVGNNLARDILGARRSGLITVWTHWNERYPTQPASEEERPDYTIGALPELPALVARIERDLMYGGGRFDLETARRYAPELRFDACEPFFPVLVGCTRVDQPTPSPSFPRILRPPQGGLIVEYAVYWDWDIGHHYELEHLWVHAGADGRVVRFEASWHGGYHELWPHPGLRAGQTSANADAPVTSEATLVAYSQPGKHAFAPDPEWFTPRERFAASCNEHAGNSGFLVTPLFIGHLTKAPERDALSHAYLIKRRFTPSWSFDRSFALRDQVTLVSWPDLDRAIRSRTEAWMDALAAGKEQPDGLLG